MITLWICTAMDFVSYVWPEHSYLKYMGKNNCNLIWISFTGRVETTIIKISKCKREDKSPEYFFRSQEQVKPEPVRRRKSPSPKVTRPRIKLNLQPPPDLPPPIERVKVVLPEMPRMQIKFSTCTTLYKPAKPIYEDYKTIKSKNRKIHQPL